MAGISSTAAIFAGTLMILGGTIAIVRAFGWQIGTPRYGKPPGRWRQFLMAGQRHAMRLTPVRRALYVGLLSSLLPCGWLWAFCATAAGAAHPVFGAAVMIAFWLGTVPIMLGLGAGLRPLVVAIGARMPVVTASAVVAIGLVTIAIRLHAAPTSPDPFSIEARTSMTTPAVPTTPKCHDTK